MNRAEVGGVRMDAFETSGVKGKCGQEGGAPRIVSGGRAPEGGKHWKLGPDSLRDERADPCDDRLGLAIQLQCCHLTPNAPR